MAKAKKITKVIREVVYTLTLTEKEVAALSALVSVVGGDPNTTSRKYTEAIDKALGDAGFNWSPALNNRLGIKGSVQFTNYSK